MEFRILGPLEVLDEGRELPLGPSKEQAVLAVLLLHPRSVVSRTQLIDSLWGQTPPPTAQKAVNVYVSQLRKTLSRAGGESIVTRPPGYLLPLESEALDSARFERLTTNARACERVGKVEKAAALMREALALWRGAALAGVELEGEGRDEIARLEELRLAAHLDLIDYELALGRHEQLLPELEPLVAQHPLDERLRSQLILALYRSGRQADALRAYRETRQTLVETLGIEPSEPLQRLEHAILNHDPSLEAPAGTARARPRPSSSTTPGRQTDGAVRRRLRRRWIVIGAALLAVGAAALGLSVRGRESKPRLHANSIGMFDRSSGQLLAVAPVGDRPIAATVGGGAVWVANAADATVTRVDPDTLATRTIGLPAPPVAIAAGTGAVWVAVRAKMLVRVDDSSGTTDIPLPAEPTAVVTTRDGVWVAVEYGVIKPGLLLLLDPTTYAVRRRAALVANASALAAGGGKTWIVEVTSFTDDSGLPIELMTATTADPIYAAELPSAGAVDGPHCATTFRGNLWVPAVDRRAVWRLSGQIGDATPMPIPSRVTCIAAAADSLWLTSLDGSIRRFDPGTGDTSLAFTSTATPTAITSGFGRIWVAAS